MSDNTVAQPKTRTIDELLEEKTFQGMTDDEIKLVIGEAAKRAAINATFQEAESERQKRADEMHQKRLELMQQIIDNANNTPQLPIVSISEVEA